MTENLLTNDIPEKFRDEAGVLKADVLLRSYKELEKKQRDVDREMKRFVK